MTLSGTTQANDVTYYVPFVYVFSQTIPGAQAPSFVYWSSSTFAFNAGPQAAFLQFSAVYGGGLWIPFGYAPCGAKITLPPNSGANLDGCVFPPPFAGGLGFVEIAAEPSITVFASVNRVVDVAGCGIGAGVSEAPIYTPIPQGSIPLPVFRGFFPAGSTVTAGPVDLGSLDHPGTCITGPMAHRRRVNVTLFNGGTAEGSFTVTARRLWYAYSDPIYRTTVTVPARDVLQLNAVPIPLAAYPPDYVGLDEQAFLSISSTQPFLAYVSTIFEGGEPGTNPVTILEPRPSN